MIPQHKNSTIELLRDEKEREMKLKFYTHKKSGGLYRMDGEYSLKMKGDPNHQAIMIAYRNAISGEKLVQLKSEFNDGRYVEVMLDRAEADTRIRRARINLSNMRVKTQDQSCPPAAKPSPPHHAIVPFPRPTLANDRLDPVAGLKSASVQNPISKESIGDFLSRIGHLMKTHVIRPDDSVEKELEWSVKKISEEFELLQVETDKGWYSIRRVHGSTVTGIVYRAIFREHLTHQIGMVQELGSVNELKEICFRHYKGMI